VKRWVDDGTISAHRTAGGHRRIPLSAAIEFIRRNRIVPVSPESLSLVSMPAMGEIDAAAADELRESLMRDEIEEVRALITGRFMTGAEVAAIGDGLIRPVLERIGELWRSQGDGILIEHRAVMTCVQVLLEVGMWLPPLPENAPQAVAAAGPADPYVLPPLLCSLVLRECGVLCRNLGPNTPVETMMVAADRYRPRLMAVSLSTLEARSGAMLASLGGTLAERGARLVIGGRQVDLAPAELRERAQVGGSMVELSAYVRGLLHGGPQSCVS
jgi:MerR family transcriptional regulator, light-induced transcriptional regulator